MTFVPDVAGFYRFRLVVRDTRDAASAPAGAELGAAAPAGLQLEGVPGQLPLGHVATVTIHLPAAAGPGGVQVDLVSDGPSVVDLPARVTVVAGYQATALAPIGPFDKQSLLAAPSVDARLRAVRDLLAEQVELLQARLAGG